MEEKTIPERISLGKNGDETGNYVCLCPVLYGWRCPTFQIICVACFGSKNDKKVGNELKKSS